MTDKRSVHTDALATLGTIIDETAARDAIHLAVEPMVAGESLICGSMVRVEGGKAFYVRRAAETVGIVDPFLFACGKYTVVPAGERFWLVLLPRTITSLRHVWSHPAFPEPAQSAPAEGVEASKKWIEDYAENIELSYNTLMEGVRSYLTWGDSLSFGNLLEGEYLPDEFWDHYEIVTGETVPDHLHGSFFSCAC